ncbi:MAG: phosphoribosylamine--glycine ligase [Steroidobacteraceae bacterium]
MKILVIGSGGREHALAWKCAQSPRVSEVIVAPGNAGTAREHKLRNVAIGVEQLDQLADLAAAEGVAFTIVGPEVPLVAGIVDVFEARGLRCFGPRKAAAQLEGSKSFTKAFLERHGIPTAGYRKFTRATFDRQWLAAQTAPIVVKASGLAAGKGVIIAQTAAEAVEAAESMLGGRFGSAGEEIVIEEFLDGEEATFIVMCDGRHALPMATSQDHKRLKDGDQGPNTGGMGAYSPAPVVTPLVHERVMREVIEPTIAGLAKDGMPFTGFLYAGLMIDAAGKPKVIEYNVRFGDPETQPVMMRLKSDLTVLVEAALEGRLDGERAEWDPRAAVGVVIAASGYPDEPRKGDVVNGLDSLGGLPGKLFHAGTTTKDGKVVTSGGRVFCAVGLGGTVKAAQREAYAIVDAVDFAGAQCRRDIGYRAIAREGG